MNKYLIVATVYSKNSHKVVSFPTIAIDIAEAFNSGIITLENKGHKKFEITSIQLTDSK